MAAQTDGYPLLAIHGKAVDGRVVDLVGLRFSDAAQQARNLLGGVVLLGDDELQGGSLRIYVRPRSVHERQSRVPQRTTSEPRARIIRHMKNTRRHERYARMRTDQLAICALLRGCSTCGLKWVLVFARRHCACMALSPRRKLLRNRIPVKLQIWQVGPPADKSTAGQMSMLGAGRTVSCHIPHPFHIRQARRASPISPSARRATSPIRPCPYRASH